MSVHADEGRCDLCACFRFAANLSRRRVEELQAAIAAAHAAPTLSLAARKQLREHEEEVRREKRQYILHVRALRELRVAYVV
jgi:hypothetical protein